MCLSSENQTTFYFPLLLRLSFKSQGVPSVVYYRKHRIRRRYGLHLFALPCQWQLWQRLWLWQLWQPQWLTFWRRWRSGAHKHDDFIFFSSRKQTLFSYTSRKQTSFLSLHWELIINIIIYSFPTYLSFYLFWTIILCCSSSCPCLIFVNVYLLTIFIFLLSLYSLSSMNGTFYSILTILFVFSFCLCLFFVFFFFPFCFNHTVRDILLNFLLFLFYFTFLQLAMAAE